MAQNILLHVSSLQTQFTNTACNQTVRHELLNTGQGFAKKSCRSVSVTVETRYTNDIKPVEIRS